MTTQNLSVATLAGLPPTLTDITVKERECAVCGRSTEIGTLCGHCGTEAK